MLILLRIKLTTSSGLCGLVVLSPSWKTTDTPDFCNIVRNAAKKTIPNGHRNNYIGMRSVKPSTQRSCGLLRETTQVWLLQFYLPNVTGSRGIDGPKQFGASTFYTLVERHPVFLTTFLVDHNTLLVIVPFQLMLLHLS